MTHLAVQRTDDCIASVGQAIFHLVRRQLWLILKQQGNRTGDHWRRHRGAA